MSALMTAPRHIAPGAAAPVSLAPGVSPPSQSKVVVKPSENVPPVIGANDIIFVNGQAFNGRGYPVCGVANQRGRLCGRIGTCPFHSKKNSGAKRPRSGLALSNDPTASDTASGKACNALSLQRNNESSSNSSRPGGSGRNMHPAIRQMSIPPRRSRFKRSWTTDEHRRFLQAMRLHGKGKWKEIAVEVKTRNANQCQSHAQKYFLRQAKSDSERKKKSIHDVTEEDVSNETTASLIWPPNVLQSVSQGLPPSVTSTHLPVASQHGVGATPLISRPATSGVPLAPRVSPEQTGSRPMAIGAASRLANVQRRQAGAGSSLNLVFPGESDQPVWGTAAPISSGGGTNTPVSGMMSVHTNSGSGKSLVPSTSGTPTVPMVFPMTSLGLQYASMVPSFMNPSLGNASNSAVVAPPPSSKTRVTVHVNGKLKGGMALMLTESLHEFFEQAQAKLQFDGNFARVFTRSGGEITNIDEMCQDDMLWLSTGEDFLTPR